MTVPSWWYNALFCEQGSVGTGVATTAWDDYGIMTASECARMEGTISEEVIEELPGLTVLGIRELRCRFGGAYHGLPPWDGTRGDCCK